MTDKQTPTDGELKAMWQLHAADIGGIFDFARAALAKWGQPAQAAEPYGYVYAEWVAPIVGDERKVIRTVFTQKKPPCESLPLYAAPQPVAREPLSHAQAKALVLKYGNDPLNLVFQVELAHGIKGANND